MRNVEVSINGLECLLCCFVVIFIVFYYNLMVKLYDFFIFIEDFINNGCLIGYYVC